MTAVVNRFYVMLRCMTIFYASRNSNLLYNVTPNLKKIVKQHCTTPISQILSGKHFEKKKVWYKTNFLV